MKRATHRGSRPLSKNRPTRRVGPGRPSGYSTQGRRLVLLLLDLVASWPASLHVDVLAQRHGVWARTIRRDLHVLEELGQASPQGPACWVWRHGAERLPGARKLFGRPLPIDEREALTAMGFGFRPRRELRRAAGL